MTKWAALSTTSSVPSRRRWIRDRTLNFQLGYRPQIDDRNWWRTTQTALLPFLIALTANCTFINVGWFQGTMTDRTAKENEQNKGRTQRTSSSVLTWLHSIGGVKSLSGRTRILHRSFQPIFSPFGGTRSTLVAQDTEQARVVSGLGLVAVRLSIAIAS
ncbi:hypothetical protein IW261DRAFT_1488543 [Armillaria novae-zelandiae]|uniref:Uncharacterized protein n=1 Tax=Armillaria novae-zelandiae TaxID=153914 RepID=A0AA39P4M8_9AGAR|nr:hypothetical protein IW261DRAFT_1488543 [Armillaria novae-zelandiae]